MKNNMFSVVEIRFPKTIFFRLKTVHNVIILYNIDMVKNIACFDTFRLSVLLLPVFNLRGCTGRQSSPTILYLKHPW